MTKIFHVVFAEVFKKIGVAVHQQKSANFSMSASLLIDCPICFVTLHTSINLRALIIVDVFNFSGADGKHLKKKNI